MSYGMIKSLSVARTTSVNASTLISRRYLSKLEPFNLDKLPRIRGLIDHNSIFVISLPITTKRSYFYCNHRPSILDKSQLKTFPLLTKIETKATGLVKKGWNKLSTSESKINKQIIKLVTKLLYTIPYEENSLRSFPSRNSMIREINEEALVHGKVQTDTGALVQQEIDNLKIPTEQVKRIPLIYPEFQKGEQVLDQLRELRDVNRPKHLKYSIGCLIGIPITLPFALVPVVPNVPGFYVAYRAYCHLKALWGVKHLGYLLETDNSTSATQHLEFKEMSELSDVYNQSAESINTEDIEELLITKDIINNLCTRFDLAHLKEDLLKALDQESKRLNKKLQDDEIVD